MRLRLVLVFFPLVLRAALPMDPVAYVESQLVAGERSIVVPKGDYRMNLPKGRKSYFRLVGLKDVVIDFSGSRLWGEVKARMFSVQSCTNLVLCNVTVDYPFDLPFTQAEIVEVDGEQNWRVKILSGYPRPDTSQMQGRIWPVQAYDRTGEKLVNPMRFRDGIRIDRLGSDEYRISGGLDRRGAVGDIAVWSVGEYGRQTENGAFCLEGCSGCTLENCTVYATPMGCGFVEFGAEGNTYRQCRLDRCPPEADPVPREVKRLRSGNHDAFNSRRSYRGPTLDGCRFAWHCDDCVNISGFCGLVTRRDGRSLRVCPIGGLVPCADGDSCQVITLEGACLPDVKVATCEPDGTPTTEERKMFEEMKFWSGIANGISKAYRVTLAADVEVMPGSMLISNRRQGNGFVVRNCMFGPNRARGLLLKASDGLVVSNRIRGVEGPGIQIAAENAWMEGGCSRNILLADNVLEDNGGGIVIGGRNNAGQPIPANAHRNIRLCGNRVISPAPALRVIGCTGLIVSNNMFQTTGGEMFERINCKDVVEFAASWLKLGAPFVAGAVLQRGMKAPIWGRAAPGARVTVRFAGMSYSATADADGRWRVDIGPLEACASPRLLEVVAMPSGETCIVPDVLVGEVWLASGQSNMECPIWDTNPRYRDGRGALAVAMTREPEVRFFKVRRTWSVRPMEDAPGKWRPFTPEAFAEVRDRPWLSAVAFYYALDIRHATRVPVGVIDASWGGTNIDAWTPRCGLATRSDLKETMDYPVREIWTAADRRGPVTGPIQQPTVLWNGMVAPFVPFALRGMIWYQGCHNAGEAHLYCSKMHALYNGCSQMFEIPALAFYFVELAPWKHSWFDIQQAQHRFADEQSNAAIAVTCDIGNPADIHPNDKAAVAHRLAAHALKRLYGFGGLQDCSPKVRKTSVSNDVVTVVLADASSLYFYNADRSRPSGFELLAKDGTWHSAEIVNLVEHRTPDGNMTCPGMIDGRVLRVKSSTVLEPYGIRYLHEAPWRGSIYNEVGLPLGSFLCRWNDKAVVSQTTNR